MKWFDAQEKMPEDGWALIRFKDGEVRGGWMSTDSWQECGALVYDYRLYYSPHTSDRFTFNREDVHSWMPVEGPHPCREMGWALRGKGGGK